MRKVSLISCLLLILPLSPIFGNNRVIDICIDNTDKDYQVYSSSITIRKGDTVTVYTSRYTEFKPVIKGDGTLVIYSGGERTWLGAKDDKSYPDWSDFTGDVHIYPYKEVKDNCGFYGVILCSGGKTFNPEDIENSLEKTNSQLANNRVFLHDGATLATNTGKRAARIGELIVEAGGTVQGPIKAKDSNGGYFVVGGTDSDAEFDGQILPAGTTTQVGFVKDGKGTLRITGNNNLITGSIRVMDGCVLLNNDAETAQAEMLPGAIGALDNNNPGIYVFENATVGGTGHSASIIDLYGNLQPGDNGIGTLTLADFEKGADVALRLRPTSKLRFEIASAESYDRINVSGALDYWNICQDFTQSDHTPIIYLLPTEENSIKAGDTFTLVSAKEKTSRGDVTWNFRIQYPKCYTWEVTEEETADGVAIVAKVISLDYSGQGEVEADVDSDVDVDVDIDIDYSKESSYRTSLRGYAETLGKQIGVATPCWGFDLSDYSLTETKAVGREFNLLVSENGTKYENTEPSKNSFDYTLADRVTALGEHFDCEVRGHTFVWHKQNPGWLTDGNGTKNPSNFTRDELLSVLKNHIENLVAHFKGKIVEWDAVNEVLSDDQTAIRSNPDAYDLRESIWKTVIGEDFIDSTFVWAHRADPSLRLYLNDYGVEFMGVAKTEALYNLAKRLKNSGIPIDGVGLQCHLDAGEIDGEKLSKNIARYTELGLECIITELDISCDETAEGLKQQAKDYAAITRAMIENDNCTKMVVWGLKDNDSWRGGAPLLYTSSNSRKLSYFAVHYELRQAAEATDIKILPSDSDAKTVVAVRYYNLQGQLISAPQCGLIIQEKVFGDGSRETQKVFVKTF